MFSEFPSFPTGNGFIFPKYIIKVFLFYLKKDSLYMICNYFSGSCQGAKQTGNVSGSFSCLNKNNEGGPADDEGTGDFLSQCCQGTLQFH